MHDRLPPRVAARPALPVPGVRPRPSRRLRVSTHENSTENDVQNSTTELDESLETIETTQTDSPDTAEDEDTTEDGDTTDVPEAPAPPPAGFADYGVTPAIVEALARVGITSPFPIQAMTLPVALDGHDIIGQAKTGTGKTLGFGI